METHMMVDCLRTREEQIKTYPAPPEAELQMQSLYSQRVVTEKWSERQCHQLNTGLLPFGKPVCIWRWVYQALARGTGKGVQQNTVQDALKAGITTPQNLTKDNHCLDRAEAWSRKLKVLKGQAGGLYQVHLRCLIWAKYLVDKNQSKGFLRTIERWAKFHLAKDQQGDQWSLPKGNSLHPTSTTRAGCQCF